MLGTDDTAMALAERLGGVWKPKLHARRRNGEFLQDADPEQFEMWVEEVEDA